MKLLYNIGNKVSVKDSKTKAVLVAGTILSIKDEVPCFSDGVLTKKKMLLISFDQKHYFNVTSNSFVVENNCNDDVVFNDDILSQYAHTSYNGKHVSVYDIYIENTINELDDEVVRLVHALNRIPNVITSGSCSGHGIEPLWVSMTFRDVMTIKFIASLLYDRFRDEFVLSTLNSRLQNTCDGVELALISLDKGEKAYRAAQRFCDCLEVYLDTLFE